MPEANSAARVFPDTHALDAQIDALLRGSNSDPFALLGPHPISLPAGHGWAVRFFLPWAESAGVLVSGANRPVEARRIRSEGFFEAILTDPHAGPLQPSGYRILYRTGEGADVSISDTYAFPLLLSDFDLHLFGEGRHYDTYEKLGAHIRELEGVRGVQFALWAPNARRVSVVGDFNRWDGRVHAMRSRGSSGIWELFLPGLEEGAIYKYEIAGPNGDLLPLKSDPYAFRSELRPANGSVVARLDSHTWSDSGWLARRASTKWLESPISIYEVHLGGWRRIPEENSRWLTYRELGDQLIPHVKSLGYTHIELLPIMEHPYDGSWGYQTLGYFAATSRYGTPAQFQEFVDRCHAAGIGVILDWTPAHFPRDAHGLAQFDGTALYEHADPRKGAHPDWGTLIYNYGRNEVQNYLLSNALFWFDKFHIDGLRVDAVASMLYLDYSRQHGEWIPNQFGGRENLEAIAFLKRLNEVAHSRFPGILTIAEESTSWPGVSRPTYLGGLGFSLKWNMGWMNDTLKYFSADPVHRKYEHNKLTFSMLYAFSENFVLPFSHDEVVHGKGSMLHKLPGDMWQQFANLRLLYAYQYAHPGKKLLFMGSEFAQRAEFTETASLDWHLTQFDSHAGIQRLVADLNRLYSAEPALHQVDFDWHGFQWIDCNNADDSVLSFLRRSRSPSPAPADIRAFSIDEASGELTISDGEQNKLPPQSAEHSSAGGGAAGNRPEDIILVVANFTPVIRHNYRVGVPHPGSYSELLNTDSASYGGSNAGNLGGAHAAEFPHHGQQYSVVLTLPPLAAIFLKWRPSAQ